MKTLVLTLLLAAAGNVIYHLGQKSIAPHANPMVALMAVYAVAFVLAGLSAPFFDSGDVGLREQLFAWPVPATAAGIVLIEVGFLLAYRSGGSPQWAGVAVASLAAMLLIPLSVVFFRESLSSARILGVLLTLGGLALIGRG